MVEQITKGIKISVTTKYIGTSLKNNKLFHIFPYFINIKNTTSEVFQLKNRCWKIYDSLNHNEIVKGEGVVGQTPILQPNEIYSYSSGCFLESTIGAMKGYYTMENYHSKEQIKVIIPTFQLITPILSN
ncbi:Co2+/Mg2+ efflux protein ApaG [uncultured Polaribacter sp.]|uniref:Co2+/Mg2+ efflux protein ApaG n=1 Tax=uncultured Polaribacter sp. TaxID=174711 RepID=UPI0026081C5F|nr:Co2+/Mg2+ efflux protein ApaG [uncultured Polaribacter sp.]